MPQSSDNSPLHVGGRGSDQQTMHDHAFGTEVGGGATLVLDPSSHAENLSSSFADQGYEDPIHGSVADESRCGFVPGYSIVGSLGRGGMGIVYQAVQEKLQRIVALKVLKPAQAHDAEYIEAFRREAMAVARLNHPNVVAAYDYGEADGRFFLAIEYVEGLDGSEMLAREGHIDEYRAVCIARDTVLGLSHALQHGIIHRDVKPANLMLVDEVCKDASGGALGGLVKVTDLGLAQIRENATALCRDHRRTEVVVGTPSYMSPEQARGEVVDFRGDIYSLGATLYHFVTGHRPFGNDDVYEILRRKETDRLPHPTDLADELSDELVLVLERMMAHAREDRYQSYEELLLDLQALVVGMAPTTSRLSRSKSSFHGPKRRRTTSRSTRSRPMDDTPAPFQARPLAAKPHRWRRAVELGIAFMAGVVCGFLLT